VRARKLKVPNVGAHPFTPLRVLPGLPDAEPCPCRKVSDQLYAVAKGCARHDDGCNFFGHVHPLPCLACDEDRRRA
jgi:hypothetical protein